MDNFKIHDNICKADINARYARMLGSKFPEEINKYSDSDRLNAMLQENAFFRSVNLLHALLATRYERTELKIMPALKNKIKKEKYIKFKNPADVLERKMVILLKWLDDSYPMFEEHDKTMLSIQDDTDILTEIRIFRRREFGVSRLLEIEKEYKLSQFDIIRNNVTAHSNRQSTQTGSFIPIKEGLINKLCKITKALVIESHFWLDYAPKNNYEFILEE